MRRFITIIVILILILAIFHIIIFLLRPSEPIGIVDGIKFNSTPKKIIRLLGKPTSTVDYSSLSESIYYSFEKDLYGVQTHLVFDFYKNRRLYSVYAIAEVNNAEEANRLFEIWRDKMIDTYKIYDGFFCYEKKAKSSTSYYQQLGLSLGAVGLSCTIEVDGNTVSLSCTRDT